MSILIKDMEMPTTCRDCCLMPFCNIALDDICSRDWGTKRCDNCPLIPVPPHGDLIDRGALIKVFKTKAKNPLNQETTPYSWAFAYECLADAVGDMPTIIPAEEDE